jgi:hypothetical protein
MPVPAVLQNAPRFSRNRDAVRLLASLSHGANQNDAVGVDAITSPAAVIISGMLEGPGRGDPYRWENRARDARNGRGDGHTDREGDAQIDGGHQAEHYRIRLRKLARA